MTWWRIHSEGPVALRSRPALEARTPVILQPGNVVNAKLGLPGWVVTPEGLWLPVSCLTDATNFAPRHAAEQNAGLVAAGRATTAAAGGGTVEPPSVAPPHISAWTSESVAAWLRDELLLPCVADAFAKHNVDGALAAGLTDDNLRFAMGVDDAATRDAVLRAVRIMTEYGMTATPRASAKLRLIKEEAVSSVMGSLNHRHNQRTASGGGDTSSLLDAVYAAGGNYIWWRFVSNVRNKSGDAAPQEGRSKFAPWVTDPSRAGVRPGWEVTLAGIMPSPLLPNDLMAHSDAAGWLLRSVGTSGTAVQWPPHIERKCDLDLVGKFEREKILPAPEREVRALFRSFDINNSGTLGVNELRMLLHQLHGGFDDWTSEQQAIRAIFGVESGEDIRTGGGNSPAKPLLDAKVDFQDFYVWWQETVVHQFIASIPLLKGLNMQQRLQMTQVLKTCTFSDGEYIIRQGEFGENMFILIGGCAVVTVNTSQQPADATNGGDGTGESDVLKTYQIGDYFGELALITSNLRSANIKAVGETMCYEIDRHVFERYLGPCIKVT